MCRSSSVNSGPCRRKGRGAAGYGSRRGEPWGEGSEKLQRLAGKWNKARVYAKTIAAFAERLAASSRSQ
jgi:hypothetical protein